MSKQGLASVAPTKTDPSGSFRMSQLASACQCGDTKCGGGGGAGERGRGIEVKQARCGGSAHTGSLVRAWTIGVSTLSMYELSLGTDPKSANSPLVFDSAAASQSTKVTKRPSC